MAFRAVADGGGSVLGELYALTFLALAWQVILYALDRPFRAGPLARAALDTLNVIIAVPLFNEDPAIARASLLSLLEQTRPPDHVYVVDDGSDVPEADYTAVRPEIAVRAAAAGVRFTWIRTENRGKRHAQAVAIKATPDADVYLTVDSDSRLDRRAVAELIAPFASPRVQSVAGVFLTANNHGPDHPAPPDDEDDTGDDENEDFRRPWLLERWLALTGPVVRIASWRGSQLLCRVLDLLYLPSQLLVRGGMSVTGSVLVNSGAIAAYRAGAVREALPVYLEETFLGAPVGFSDDSMLTLQAFLRGRTVHQPTAFAFAIMPEKFSHHRRQYLRWMRGSFIRSWWRFRYLPVRSYAFWWHLAGWILSAVSGWAFTDVVVTAVVRGEFRWSYLLIPAAAGYALALPYLTVSRSDETFRSRLLTWSLAPLAVLWALTVLRAWRWYGAATCKQTGWGTRQNIEVTLGEEHAS